MKLKTLAVLSTTLLLSGALVSVASAEGVGLDIHTNVNATAQVQTEDHGNSTSNDAREDVHDTGSISEDINGTDTDVETNDDGQLSAQAHRSTVATFVQSLLAIANREGGIGAQVRAVAKAQNDSASTSEDAIIKVEKRGGMENLFFGSDFTSLGQLRSEMVKTQANIDQLKTLLDKTTDATDKKELSAQITVLEASEAKINAFVNVHENSFSFFGWFNKLFAKE